ncbi:helicase, SNF2 family [Microscilla marina ATCC 23134]|uniref:Helicase, SNF2 family n=2 Tax=Microscilla marina TaxID=1027 RepID=A1ZSR7_MICM2|nr:helicase, SNF2 family [Microscilla marina ATCC 23134]
MYFWTITPLFNYKFFRNIANYYKNVKPTQVMAKKYGNTWWGQQWLNALNNIDFSNRLPRGRTYANKGAVLDVEIKENVVTAKVQGSERYPYKQKLEIKEFSDAEKDDILDIITEDPFILSSLLNRELPHDLLDILNNKGIQLFPNSWRSIQGSCSCPDWAVPCKHLAAVIYIIGNEIDKNPFMVFLLHGLDVLAEIQKRGFTSHGDFKLPVTPLRKLLADPSQSQDYSYQLALTKKIDFSTLPPSKENLLQLLPAKPLFFHEKDFKGLLEQAYTKVAKGVKKEQKLLPEVEESFFDAHHGEVSIILGSMLDLHYAVLKPENEQVQAPPIRNTMSLIGHVRELNPAHLHRHHPSVVALYFTYQFTTYLATNSAFIPELLEIEANLYVIRWVPALLVDEVTAIFDILVQLMPPEMLAVTVKDKLNFVTPEEQVKMLTGVFLHHFMTEHYTYNNKQQYNDTIFLSFFDHSTLFVQGFTQKENAQAIQKWLQKFYLSNKEYLPVLKVEEIEDDEMFELSFWVQKQGAQMDKLISVKDLFHYKKYKDLRLGIIQDLAVLAEYLPAIKQLIKEKGDYRILVGSEDFVQIFMYTLPALQLLSIQVLLPKALQRLARPQLSGRVQAEGSSGASKSFVDLKQMLSFDWQVALGDTLLSPDEFRKVVRKLKGIVKLNDEYVLFDQKEVETLLKKLDKPPKITDSEVLRAALAADYKGAKVGLDNKARELIRGMVAFDTVASPKDLKATLRPYQQRGYEWLYKNAQLGFGSLLADDMGLGKTLQVISLMLKLKEEGKLNKKKALVIVPTTLLGNWQKEINKFAPGLQTAIYHGPNRQLDLKQPDIIITSYGIARSDIQVLSKIKWAFLAIDEAQNIKNNATEQTKAIKKIKTDRVVAMSGTPVENRLSEYWSIFDFTNKGYLGALTKFKDEFIKPIELERSQAHLDRFKKVTAPFILRRIKTDKSIISDLPDKITNDQICSLTKEQTALYQNVVDMIMRELNGKQGEEGKTRKGLIFQLMNALKQICNHPSHYLKHAHLDPGQSGKTQLLLSLLDNIYENGEKTLIFTQYREMGDLLLPLLEQRYHNTPLWLHGGVSRKKRDQMVEDFQNKPHVKTMLLSLKAGGTGLNLTKASNVIHYDLWWNPAVENQATDRAYRIGQQNNVMVYRMITQGTFEEKINAMIQTKKELADLTVSTGENWIGDMSNQELKEVFDLEKG